MITLDTNLYLLCSLFNIKSSKLNSDYSGMSVEEIMEAEAAQGNTTAAQYSQIIGDPAKLIELFELNNPSNKYAILSNMNENDLDDMLPYLGSDDLITGLNYFTKSKLLTMVQDLPQSQLVNYVTQMFSTEHLMALMPEDQLNSILTSSNIDKSLELNSMQSLSPEILIQMYEAATGKQIDVNLNQDASTANSNSTDSTSQSDQSGQSDSKPVTAEIGLSGNLKNVDTNNLLNQISGLSEDQFKEAMTSIPQANKQFFVLQMSKKNDNILQMVDPQVYTSILNDKKDKDDLIRYADVLNNNQLIKMTEQLPKDLTAVVLTQIDTNIFANELVSKFKNVLSEIIAA